MCDASCRTLGCPCRATGDSGDMMRPDAPCSNYVQGYDRLGYRDGCANCGFAGSVHRIKEDAA